jgi:uncharacterized membrane protein YkoI
MTTNSDSPENRPQPSDADTTPIAPSGATSNESAATTGATQQNATAHTPAEPATTPRRRRVSKRTLWIGGAVAGVLALGGAGIAIADELNDGGDALDDATRDRVAAAATAYTDGGELIDAERDDDGGYDAEVRLDDGTEVDVRLDDDYTVLPGASDSAGGDRSDDADDRSDDTNDRTNDNGTDDDRTDDDGTSDQGAGSSGSTDADDVPLSADETARASDAALAETGEGEVVDVDRSDDRDHTFEVEVRLADGSEVDVHLDADFAVVSSTPSP